MRRYFAAARCLAGFEIRITGLARGKTVREVEDKLLKFTPDQYKKDARHWLILHGRYECKARIPECWRCLIRDLCEYPHKTPAPPGWAGAAAPVGTSSRA